MRLTWTAALAAVVLLAVPFAHASFEITPTGCKPNAFKWASSCYPAATEAGGYKFGDQTGMTLTGPQYFRTNQTISGAGDYTVLYEKECAAKDIKIKVPVPAAGVYQVTLLESEIYFTSPKDNDVRCPRVFTICTDNYMTYNDLCLFENGVNRAIALANTWYVDDGSIDLHLWSSVNMPKLGGITVQGMDCPGDVKALKTENVLSTECANAAKGIYAPVGGASPKMPVSPVVTPTTNTTANGTTNGTTDGETPAVTGTDGTTNGTTNGTMDGETPAATGTDGTTNGTTNGTTDGMPPTVTGTDGATNGTTDGETPTTTTPGSVGTAPNGTDTAPDATASPAPVGPVLPAGPPVPITTTRDLPMLPGGKAPLATTVSQFGNGGFPPEILGAPDGKTWPTEASASSTASATFAVPVSPKGITLAGNFTKGDKVNVTVSGPDADGVMMGSTATVTAPANGTSLPVPMPKGTTPTTAYSVMVALPAGSTAKIDAIKLDGTVSPATLANQQSQDNTTGTVTQWPISASDSANSPGIGGVGTGSVFAPDGMVWAPAGNGTRDLTLNYTTPVNSTALLLAAAPKKGATVMVMGNPSDGSAPVELYSGPATGGHTAAAPGTYGLYPLPLTSATNPLLSSITLSTEDPAALALDSAALVGIPKALDDGTIPDLFPSDAAATGTTAATTGGSRGVTLPIADGTPEWAAAATTGADVLPANGSAAPTLTGGADASAATGVPDGKAFAIPDASAEGLPLGSTPYLSLDYPNGKKANIVAVAGKAVAPGTLRASLVDADGKIIDLGAQTLPTPADVNTFVNFTTPNNDIINVKKVILVPTPTGSFVTDAVELNTASKAAVDSSRAVNLKTKRHHHRDGMHHRINGSKGAWIAVVTIFTILGAIICCCCLPYLLYTLLAGKGKKGGATTTVKDTTGSYSTTTPVGKDTTTGVTGTSRV